MDEGPSIVPIILASAWGEDAPALQEIVEGTRWQLQSFSTHTDALGALRSGTASIALWDREMLGPSWQEALRGVLSARKGTCVVLLSNVADPYLWDEVVQGGGFDVLTRPFHREPVLTTLLFAYTHSTARWPAMPPRRVG